MSDSEPSAPVASEIPLSIVTAREQVRNNPWINERWKVVGVIATAKNDRVRIDRSVLRAGPDSEQYLWNGFSLRLRPSEADGYYYNIIGQNPSVYVFCELDDAGEPRPQSVTAEYMDAISHSEGGNASYAVPMPPEVYRFVEQFVLAHFVPEERKMKRKHERAANRADVWDDE